MLVTQPKVSEVTERTLAIVRFGPPTDSDGLRPAEYYQVVVDPYHFSPCGCFIRFGAYGGDELVGWQRADALYVVSELKKVPHDSDLQDIPWYNSPALEKL